MKKDYFISPENFSDDSHIYFDGEFLTFGRTESHRDRFSTNRKNLKTDENSSKEEKTEEIQR